MEHQEGVDTSSVVPSQPLKRRFHINKWQAITAVLVIIIAVQGFLYLSLSSSYNTLNAEHGLLTEQCSEMQSELSAMHSNYDPLLANYTSLQTSYNSLQASHNSLQSNYNSLNSKYNSYVSSYSSIRDQINKRCLITNPKSFITPSENSVQNKVQEITGGWSDPSDWDECWTDEKLMYDWVVANIEYRADGLYPELPSTPSGSVEYQQEMWQLPSETLDLMQGDCEDMAILLTSMIICYTKGQYKSECIAITGSDGGHVAVQIPVEGKKLTILDPAGNYYTQTSGIIDNKDISEEINNWLNYWKSSLGGDVYVDRVFSNTLDKSFSSTSSYISWMNSR
jgi:hypothetical protein